MKKIALLLSLVLVVSLSLSAQNRSSKSSQDKKVTQKKERKEVKSEVKSAKSTKAIKIDNSRSVRSESQNNDRKRGDVRNVNANSNRSNSNNRARVESTKTESRRANSSDRVSVKPPKSNRAYKQIEAPSRQRANTKVDRHGRADIRSPRSYSRGIHHGHIANHNHPSFGYNRHEIVIFPRRVNYHFWPNHYVMLYSSYVPEYEYPWAIYEAEDQMACIEGVVIDYDFDRRSQQYILHFGRQAPYQSASVIIPRHLSKYLSRKMIRKLKRDYVSVCGVFNDYGNVPTIKVMDLDQVYVNEIPLKEFLMYY